MASRTRLALSVPLQSGSAGDSVGEQRGLLKYLPYIDAEHKISNFRFWHANQAEVRCERGAEVRKISLSGPLGIRK